jgi:hypothetical protein
MPLSRRRRANPADQPENNNHLADLLGDAGERLVAEQPAEFSQSAEKEQNQGRIVQSKSDQLSPVSIPQTSFHAFASAQSPQTTTTQSPQMSQIVPISQVPPTPIMNGERMERQDYTSASMSGFEGGRRTARGELFRRQPQSPVAQPVAPSVGAASLQTPVHEISLPLGNLLHLAYNPGYTGSEEARKTLLEQLEQESKTGGRARCWSCGSLGIIYDRWDVRSKAFSEVGIAFCEICGVWSVM